MIKKYITDINNKIYLKEELVKKNNLKTNNIIKINNKEITKFLGFGSAITESSAYNYQKLSKKMNILFNTFTTIVILFILALPIKTVVSSIIINLL